MLRGRLVGQPWGLLGYTQHAALPLIQVVAATGVYGVSFLLALTAAACAEALRARALRPVLVPALVVALCWTGGRIVLRNAGADAPDDGRARQVALVQTNTSPVDRWTRSYIGAAVTAHVRATDSIPADAHPALVVWPEYAVPTYVERDPSLTALLAATARRHATDILFGAPRRSEAFSFNSVRLVTASGRDGGHYDKRRLVWFAETNPLAPASASAASDDSQPFASGREPGVLQSFARLGVTICHEVIHPDLVAEGVRHGAEVLVNVANDGWIGAGSLGGAEQHLAMATLRAVETRRFLVRAALTGISAVVDPFGRIVDSLPYGQRGVLVAAVRPLDETTWYVRFGDVFAYACCFVAVGALGLAERRRLLRPLGAD
jgi:apolipoprotein N-acyltransferase